MSRLLGERALAPALLALWVCSCEAEAEPPVATKARSQAIAATGSPEPPPKPSGDYAPQPKPSAPKAPRALCTVPGSERTFPETKLRYLERGRESRSASPSVGSGRWTWVNLWAAWCAPCKEELPHLLEWQETLGFRLHAISLDDDLRQLRDFLGQASSPLQETFWLPEGEERKSWLSSVGVKEDPELPVQLLFDPKGKLRCLIEGAIEEGDLPALQALLR